MGCKRVSFVGIIIIIIIYYYDDIIIVIVVIIIIILCFMLIGRIQATLSAWKTELFVHSIITVAISRGGEGA